jgi:integrase/recombinase XerD
MTLEGAHYDAWPLGHAKLDTTALYTRVATNTIREVMSPLDRLTPLVPKKNEPRDKPPA